MHESTTWDLERLLAIIADAARAHEQGTVRAQDVHGIDALDEVEIHPLLADALEATGWTCLREQRYPSSGALDRSFRDRFRCDLVLLDAGTTLADPLEHARDLDAHPLFGDQPPPGVPPEDACWIEVKVLSAARCSVATIDTALDDLAKLANDELILVGGLLFMLFAPDEATGRETLNRAWTRGVEDGRCSHRPLIEWVPIADRRGHGGIAIGLFRAPVSP
ncbi:MAG: hypothetical protein KDA28_05645 [Phycisphaerales bacterium]|nr:hypothetical protein [Phycisphaerales bacterium]